jgi:hypothetical protein
MNRAGTTNATIGREMSGPRRIFSFAMTKSVVPMTTDGRPQKRT